MYNDDLNNLALFFVLAMATNPFNYPVFINDCIRNAANIPEGVTRIRDYTFSDCIYLTRITLPNSVTSIGEYAFNNCYSLTDITLPNTLTSIERGAFYNCMSLTDITLPNTLESIGRYAFYWCASLTSITLPATTNNRIEDFAFYGCASLTSITLPDGVRTIRPSTFARCTHLGNIDIPNSVTSIESKAFEYCTYLTDITLPNTLKSIGRDAFHGCDHLRVLEFPNTLESIGDDAFHSCVSLRRVIFNTYNGILAKNIINNSSFSDCPNLQSVLIRIRGDDKLLFRGIFGWISGITNIHLIRLQGYKLEYDISFYDYDNIRNIFRAGTDVLIEDKTDEYHDAFTMNVYKDKERTTFETFVLNMKSLLMPTKDAKLGELDMTNPIKTRRLPSVVIDKIMGYSDGRKRKKSRRKSKSHSKRKSKSRRKSKRRLTTVI